MNKRNHILTLLHIIVVMIAFSCRKDDETGIGPTLQLINDSGYVSNDTSVLIGKDFKVGIIATKGDANITNFIIKITTDNVQTYLDSGLNSQGFTIDKYLTKGVSQTETWTFVIRDKSGRSDTSILIITADSGSAYGSVITIPSVTLGAQNNATTGSFLDVKNVAVYTLAQAYAVQDSIEICYYYDFLQGENNVIASPDANIDASVYTGAYGLTNWTVRNETRYLETTLTETDFNAVANDSLLIASFNYPLSKRKAKNLSQGKIFSFKTSKGKLGLFKVLNVNGTDAGTTEIMIKMQSY